MGGMNYRSTNVSDGWTHIGGALVVGVNNASGVELNPNSSGNNPIITAAGDEAVKGITIQGKGGGQVQIGASGVGFGTLQYATVQFTPPAMSSFSCVESTYTVANLTTNSMILSLTPRLAYSTQYVVHDARCSTAGEMCVRWTNTANSTIGTGESTGRWLVAWITQ